VYNFGLASMIRRREAELGIKPIGRFMDPRYGFSRTAFANGTTLQEQYAGEGLLFSPWPLLKMQSKDAGVASVRKIPVVLP
jgi:hypothetical protein